MVKEKWPGDPVVNGSHERALNLMQCVAPTELQHPELNYGPGISGELRVTHDSHQEPPDGWEHGWDVFFFFFGGGVGW